MYARAHLALAVALFAVVSTARAATITVTPTDSYTKIESAKAGDTVLVEPGTYKYRVYLSQTGSATLPITIKAKDPTSRPVWDLGGQPVSSWPGSYSAGDKGRGCWQVSGDHYVISGIIFRNCQDSSSAGLRAVDSGPLTVRDCLFEHSTNGLTGSANGFLVEFSEFHSNGKLTSTGNMTHNIYIYGGTFTLRYSYVHDPLEGQNFHIRARDAVIEYNWITRPAAYPGDVMSCNTLCGGSGTSPITQKMLLRGNVLIQGSPVNLSQLIALYNDEPGGSYDSTGAVSKMELTLIQNTVIGTAVAAGKTQRLVNMRNDGVGTQVTLHNNIIYQVAELAIPYSPSATNWSVSGQSNWVSTGTPTTGLTGSIVGSAPGFAGATAKNYHLLATSACRGKAAVVSGLPIKEYYLDETVKLQYRARSTAIDLGAFEHGNTSAPVGPYGPPLPTPDAGLTKDAGVKDSALKDGKPKDLKPKPDGAGDGAGSDAPAPDGRGWDFVAAHDVHGQTDHATGDGGTNGRGSDGCDCALGPAAGSVPALLLVLLGAVLLRGRRRRER